MDKGFIDFLDSLGSFGESLDDFTDAELKDMCEKEGGGIAEAFMHILNNTKAKEIKEKINTVTENNGLSKELNSDIDSKLANFIAESRMDYSSLEDNRLLLNMINIITHFNFQFKSNNKQEHIQELAGIISEGEDETIGDFLQRTPEDYLKILLFHLGLKSIDDLKNIFDCFYENNNAIKEEGDKVFDYDDYFSGHFEEGVTNPVEFFAMLSPQKIEGFIKKYAINDITSFNKFFLETHYIYPFIVHIDIRLLEHFTVDLGIDNFEKLIDFLSNDEIRNCLINICRGGELSLKNAMYLLNKLDIRDPLNKNNKTFNELFINNNYIYSFLKKVDNDLLKYFVGQEIFNDNNKLLDFIEDENTRYNLKKISEGGELAIKNIIYILDYYNVKNPLILQEIDSDFLEVLSTITKNNLDILLDLFGNNKLEEFIQTFLNEYIVDNIEEVDYNNLKTSLSLLGLPNKEMSNIISTVYDEDVSDSLENLNKILENFKDNLGNLGDYLLKLLLSSDNVRENTDELKRVIENLKDILSQPQTSKYIDFSRLNILSNFIGGQITSFLSLEILQTDNLEGLIKKWENIILSFENGEFNSEDELHKNLEYKKFRELSKNEKIAKYMRGRFGFRDYLHIFDKESSGTYFGETEKFELECVSYEASLLKDYILDINEKAKELGKKVLVIPNLSYGYLPVSAIIDELDDDNIDFLIGTKVGSTECHNNKEVLNSRLFKGNREQIVNEQPIIIAVDGTNHLIPRNGEGKGARYPDAYQGYLNQVITMNYANGDNDLEKMDYSNNGKDKHDLERLIQTEEFKRTVEIYKNLSKQGGDHYKFGFWNTAGKELIIRGGRDELNKIAPISSNDINGPTMIFCNVGVLDEQLPDNLKREGFEHTPAYFDDSGKIINFEYSFDNTGVKIVNSIEIELKKLAGKDLSSLHTNVSAIIEHVRKGVFTGE